MSTKTGKKLYHVTIAGDFATKCEIESNQTEEEIRKFMMTAFEDAMNKQEITVIVRSTRLEEIV